MSLHALARRPGVTLPGTSLGEERLAALIAATRDTERLEVDVRGSGWLQSLLREKRADKGPVLLLVDSPDARGFLILYNAKPTYAEALAADGTLLRGDEALRLLDSIRGPASVVLARLREKVVEWDPERLATGVTGIDLQHRQLINTLNSLYQAVLLGEARRRLRAALSFLREYTEFHFTSEERFFTRHGYPKAEEHRRQHRWFVERVRGYERDGWEEGRALDMVVFLADWTRGHIAGSDRDWATWIREKHVRERLL